MPVWHRLLDEWRESDGLAVVGLTQEQHPERCRLFAQWQRIDWPILWDPFNLSGSMVVPNIVAVDEYGTVRLVDPSPEEFEANFLHVTFGPPAEARTVARGAARELVELASLAPGSAEHAQALSLSELLWAQPADGATRDAALERLEGLARMRPEDATLAFRVGVARRMRYDSPSGHPDDFQVAIDQWARALELRPNQYIWRRRIQQYGPRLDKPYNFFRWVDVARAELEARGEVPIELAAELTPAELAEPRPTFEQLEATAEPDRGGRIARDERGLIAVDAAVAFATRGAVRTASVHLAFRPNAELDAHWNNEVEPMVVWVGGERLPTGWALDSRMRTRALPAQAVSDETRRFTFELQLEPTAAGGTLVGYALLHACEGADGKCVYLRRDFRVEVDPER